MMPAQSLEVAATVRRTRLGVGKLVAEIARKKGAMRKASSAPGRRLEVGAEAE